MTEKTRALMVTYGPTSENIPKKDLPVLDTTQFEIVFSLTKNKIVHLPLKILQSSLPETNIH